MFERNWTEKIYNLKKLWWRLDIATPHLALSPGAFMGTPLISMYFFFHLRFCSLLLAKIFNFHPRNIYTQPDYWNVFSFLIILFFYLVRCFDLFHCFFSFVLMYSALYGMYVVLLFVVLLNWQYLQSDWLLLEANISWPSFQSKYK